MSDVTFPYTGWTLQPSFKPVLVEFVEAYQGWGQGPTFHKAASGKYVALSEIFPDKEAAIAYGRAKLATMQAKIDKTMAGMAKKAAALDKAEGA